MSRSWLAVILILLLISSLAGCNKDSSSSPALSTQAMQAMGLTPSPPPPAPLPPGSGQFQVFAFNDLGMHCDDNDYSTAVVLPPYNVLHAQVVLRGVTPQLLDASQAAPVYAAVADPTGSINTTSAGKTNFWTYVQQLFHVSLAVDVGLSGARMPGRSNTPQPLGLYDTLMKWWTAPGIPITNYDDNLNNNPLPMMRVAAYNLSGSFLSSLDVVLPISNEMNCGTCHTSGGIAANAATAAKYGIAAFSANTNAVVQVKENILILHDGAIKTSLMASRPVLCSSCHYSAALDLNHVGPQGAQVGNEYLSLAMHSRHGKTVANTLPTTGSPPIIQGGTSTACYNCHPGQTTMCLRGAMYTAGIGCQDCHGGMLAVGGVYPLAGTTRIRQPWIDLPKCQSCHTGDALNHLGTTLILRMAYLANDPAATPILAVNKRFADSDTTLYRFSQGHGGMACEACHGSTHAEWPARAGANDNITPTQIQGYAREITECVVCHGTGLGRTMNGPHGMHNVNDPNFWNGGHEDFVGNGDACKTCHGTDGLGTVLSQAKANRVFGSVSIAAGMPVACNMCHANFINGGG